MYRSYWGLTGSPFRGFLDPKLYCPSPTHEEALARLRFLVGQRRRLGLLVGASGSGKSLLLEVLAAPLRREGRPVAKFSLLGVEPAEMLWRLAADWGLNIEVTRPVRSLWRSIGDRLAEYHYQQLDPVALLDDADRGDDRVMQCVARLANLDLRPDSRLSIILAGRSEGLAQWGGRLLDLAELRIEVEPWEPADTRNFIEAMLAKAGRQSPVFDEAATARLHELSRGVPRRLAQLADLSLLAGASANLPRIGPDVVDSVCQELAVQQAPC